MRLESSYEWLAAHAAAQPSAIACIDVGTGRRVSYLQLFDRVRRLAGVLRARFGVAAGDRVLIVARNSADFFELMYATWQVGAVFTPVNWRLAPAELAAIVANADPRVIVIDRGFIGAISQTTRAMLVRGSGDERSEYEAAIAAASPTDAVVAPSLDAMNTLLYTSGTTGAPRGVIGTWRMTDTMLRHAAACQELTPRSVTLTAAPLFHTAGLNSFTTALLRLGGTVVVMPRWDAREFLTLLCDRNLGVTHTLAVPTQYQMICHLPRSAGAPSAELYAAVGGAPVTPELVAACAEWGLNLRPAYGMTECFSIASIARGAAVSEHGAVGQPSAATELRIADAQGHRVPTGSIGEIQIRGAAVTPGYWRQSDETAAAFVDGWFRTRDLGRLDAAGNLYIVDRAKDMFISGGENVYPAEVEQALQSLAGVRQAAVVGVPDERWGEVGAAFIVLADGATLDRERIVAHCRERIARFKVPQHVHLVSELPLSAQGKVLKSELRKRHD